uniref:Coiled-coil domain containing 124 n=1 Tax=Poecilia reticulata TaxID=8081 RepID=A0A3P9NR68_POERE
MPKKFQGENSKAATAKARKAEAKAVADARKKKEEEDALWQETDKHVLKKEQRKVSRDEKKRLELLERKKENQRLLDEENARIKGKAQREAAAGGKVTRAQIQDILQNEEQQELEMKPKGSKKSHLDTPLEENINRVIAEEGSVEARTIEEAISVLSTGPEDLDRHPERRMKAAFTAFEEANMSRLKMENPNMRLSQLKQQLKKEWAKSPENPLNQRFASYNSK